MPGTYRRRDRKVTVRVVVRAVPPVGVKVVATRRRSGPFVRALRAAALSGQVTVSVVPVRTVRDTLHAVRVVVFLAVDDAPGARKVPRWVSFPGPGSRMRVVTVERVARIRRMLKAFDEGVVPPGLAVNAAVAARAPSTVMRQVAEVPAQSPLHPANDESADGVAVRVMVLERANVPVHVAPQVMPAGEEVTVPAPVPSVTMVRG